MGRTPRDGNRSAGQRLFASNQPGSDAAFRLVTLGRLALVGPDEAEDPSLATRPRKLALLAWLILRPGKRASRDQLIGTFWGERDDERARNSLSDALSHLRRVLGRDALVNQANDVRLGNDTPLAIDALELLAAAKSGDHDSVVALYTGPFLDGVYVDDAPAFDDWRDRERGRLAELFARSAAVRCTALAHTAQWDVCRALAERWLDVAPASAEAALMLLTSIATPATSEARATALASYDALVRRLERDLGISPHRSVTAYAADIAAQLTREPAAFPPQLVSPRVGADEPLQPLSLQHVSPQSTSHIVPSVAARPYRTWQPVTYVATAMIGVAALVIGMRQRSDATLNPRRVVVTAFENRTGDSSLSYLGGVAADWISRELMALHVTEVVDRVPVSTESMADARDVGREAGAGIVIAGAYLLRGDSIGFEAKVLDARDGRLLRTISPAMAPRSDPFVAVNMLRDRTAAALASELDIVVAGMVRDASQPPTLASYRAYVEGVDHFMHREYSAAIPALLNSARDSLFTAPLIWLIGAYGNSGEWARADSLALAVDSSRARLLPLDRALLDFWKATIHGNMPAQYAAAHQMLVAAPLSDMALFLSGFAAISVNRPLEAVQVLRRIPVHSSGGAWDVFGTRLTFALHMSGQHEDELIEARRRRSQQPRLLAAISEEARALVALGRLDDVTRAIADVATLPTQQRLTPGSVMLSTAQELRAHGHEPQAMDMFRRTAEWTRQQQTSVGSRSSAMQFLLARALYQSRDWQGADTLLRELLVKDPRNAVTLGWAGVTAAQRGDRQEALRVSGVLAALEVPYLSGANTMWRSRIAAVLGMHDDALRYVRQAMAEGATIEDIHTWTEMLPMHGLPSYKALVNPTG